MDCPHTPVCVSVCICVGAFMLACMLCVRVIPERTQEGLAPLACPPQGEGSPEPGWERLRRSE